MERENVFALVQLYQLGSGESSLHLDGFSTRELALIHLKKEVEHLKEEISDEGDYIVDEWQQEEEAYICDSKTNRYSLRIEEVKINK